MTGYCSWDTPNRLKLLTVYHDAYGNHIEGVHTMKLNNEINEKLKRYPHICGMNLEREIEENSCEGYKLVLEFCDYLNYCMEDKLSILFSGVRDLEIKNLDGLWNVHIMIKDLREDQLENINYHVTEDEENMFSFYCSSIEITSLETM